MKVSAKKSTEKVPKSSISSTSTPVSFSPKDKEATKKRLKKILGNSPVSSDKPKASKFQKGKIVLDESVTKVTNSKKIQQNKNTKAPTTSLESKPTITFTENTKIIEEIVKNGIEKSKNKKSVQKSLKGNGGKDNSVQKNEKSKSVGEQKVVGSVNIKKSPKQVSIDNQKINKKSKKVTTELTKNGNVSEKSSISNGSSNNIKSGKSKKVTKMPENRDDSKEPVKNSSTQISNGSSNDIKSKKSKKNSKLSANGNINVEPDANQISVDSTKKIKQKKLKLTQNETVKSAESIPQKISNESQKKKKKNSKQNGSISAESKKSDDLLSNNENKKSKKNSKLPENGKISSKSLINEPTKYVKSKKSKVAEVPVKESKKLTKKVKQSNLSEDVSQKQNGTKKVDNMKKSKKENAKKNVKTSKVTEKKSVPKRKSEKKKNKEVPAKKSKLSKNVKSDSEEELGESELEELLREFSKELSYSDEESMDGDDADNITEKKKIKKLAAKMSKRVVQAESDSDEELGESELEELMKNFTNGLSHSDEDNADTDGEDEIEEEYEDQEDDGTSLLPETGMVPYRKTESSDEDDLSYDDDGNEYSFYDEEEMSFDEEDDCSFDEEEDYSDDGHDYNASCEEDTYSFDDGDPDEFDDSFDSEEEEEEEIYEDGNYFDESEDTDYEPPGEEDNLNVPNGAAVKHDVKPGEVSFDDNSDLQIIELPSEAQDVKQHPVVLNKKVSKSSLSQSNAEAQKSIENENDSDDSCPELVPIDYSNDDGSECCEDCSCSDEQEASEEEEYFSDEDYEEYCHEMHPEIIKAGLLSSTSNSSEHLDTETFDSSFAGRNDIVTPNMSFDDLIVSSKQRAGKYVVVPIKGRNFNTDVQMSPVSHDESLESLEIGSPEETAAPVILKNSHDESLGSLEIGSPEDTTAKTILKNLPLKPVEMDEDYGDEEYLPSEIEEEEIAPKPFHKNSKRSMWKNDVSEETHTQRSNTSERYQFNTKFYNSVNANKVLLLLKDPIYIYGTLIATTIAGNVDIFGYTPKLNETVEVFSPRGYSSISITPKKSSGGSRKDLISKELSQLNGDFIQGDLKDILESYNDQTDAILLLQRNDRNPKIGMMKKYMKENAFPNMNSITLERTFYASEFILRCIITTHTPNALIVDPRWQTINVCEQTKMLVIGGKCVGKSTLVRYFINSHLNKYPKMLLIDLDIGQPEMFVPQTISATLVSEPLLGPGYFQTKIPQKSLLIGDINVILSPQSYIDNVKELLAYCHSNEEYRNIPWIVNTMGYNKGIGGEIIAAITRYLKPTEIVQLQSSRDINNFDYVMDKDVIKNMAIKFFNTSIDAEYIPAHRLIALDTQVDGMRRSKKGWDMAPKDMRHAMIISRLGASLTGQAEWLNDVKPVIAPLDDLEIITFGGEDFTKEELAHIVNGNLVYLCHKIAESSIIECHGIGIVRGVDFTQKTIYLIPACPLELLSQVNTLAVANIPLPTSVIRNQGPKVTGLAPYIYNTIELSATKFIKQIYHRPQRKRKENFN